MLNITVTKKAARQIMVANSCAYLFILSGYILFYSSVTEQSFLCVYLLSNSVFYLATAILIDSIIYFSNYKLLGSTPVCFFFFTFTITQISPAPVLQKNELS